MKQNSTEVGLIKVLLLFLVENKRNHVRSVTLLIEGWVSNY